MTGVTAYQKQQLARCTNGDRCNSEYFLLALTYIDLYNINQVIFSLPPIVKLFSMSYIDLWLALNLKERVPRSLRGGVTQLKGKWTCRASAVLWGDSEHVLAGPGRATSC